MSGNNIIFGRKPVFEAMEADSEIRRIFISQNLRGDIVFKIKKAAKERGIPVKTASPERIDQLCGKQNSQGIVAELEEITFASVNDVILNAQKMEFPLVLLLDSIQDTHNLGAILRSAECTGVGGVIITAHFSAPVNDTVIKTSAGAVSHLKIATVKNLVSVIRTLKDEGFWIAGADMSGEPYNTKDYKMPLALVMGNEEKGLRRLVKDNCDFLLGIPMKGSIDSLNVSVSAGVLLFEILRQREK